MTTLREPTYVFHVKRDGAWIQGTRYGAPLYANEGELSTGSPRIPLDVSDLDGRLPLLDSSRLEGATESGDPATVPVVPGEFAARWNAKTEEERAGFLRAMYEASDKAALCRMMHDGRRYVPTYDS